MRYDENGRRIVSDDEIDALLAEVDPTAHREVVGTPEQRAAALTTVQPVSAPGGGLSGLLASKAFRNLALVGATVAAIGIVAVFGFNAGGSAQAIGANPGASAAPAASAPVLDQAKVAELMGKIQANPKDADSLMALGDEYYKIGDFATAGDWFTKVTALEPTNVRGFLALGATGFNSGDLDAAEVAWRKALDIDPKSVEANYDLGFLYFNRQPPDMAEGAGALGQGGRAGSEQRDRADGEGAPDRHRQHGPGLAGTGWIDRPGRLARPLGRPRGQPRCVPRRVPGGQRGSRNSRAVRGADRDPPAMTLGAGLGLVVAFLAGVVSFASPCCLPLVPAYIGYMVGATGAPDRRRSFLHGLAFVTGFTLVFVAFWASIGAIGYALADNVKYLRMFGGAILIVFGLQVAGVINVRALWRDTRPLPAFGGSGFSGGASFGATMNQATAGNPSMGGGTMTLGGFGAGTGVGTAAATPAYGRSLLFGVVFAAGWSPCIGPILGGIIGLASSTASVAQGTVLLLAYSAGLAVPFLAIAMGATWVARRLGWVGRHHRAVSLVSGAMLVGLGVLMVTNMFARLAAFTAPLGG